MNKTKYEIIKTLKLSVINSLKRINNLANNDLHKDGSLIYQEFKEWIEDNHLEDKVMYTKYKKNKISTYSKMKINNNLLNDYLTLNFKFQHVNYFNYCLS